MQLYMGDTNMSTTPILITDDKFSFGTHSVYKTAKQTYFSF